MPFFAYLCNELTEYINVSTWSEQQVMLFYSLNTKYRNPTPTQPDSHYFSLVGVITMILTAYLEHPSEEGNNWQSREILAWDGRPKSPGCPSSTVGLKDQMTASLRGHTEARAVQRGGGSGWPKKPVPAKSICAVLARTPLPRGDLNKILGNRRLSCSFRLDN